MRKRFQRDDVTPTSIKVLIVVFVLLGWGIAIWWRHQKRKDLHDGPYWHVELAFFGLLVLLVLVALLVAAFRRRRSRRRDEHTLPDLRRRGRS